MNVPTPAGADISAEGSAQTPGESSSFGRANGHYVFEERENFIRDVFRRVVSAVRRQFWLALAIIVAALAAAMLFTMFQTQKFTSFASMQINDQSEKVLGDELDTSADANSGWDIDRFLNTQLDVLRSRSLSMRVVRALDLIGNERFYAAMEIAPPGPGLTQLQQEELVLSQLYQNLDIELPPSSRVAILRFTSGDRELSAQIANAYLDEFIKASLQTRYDSSAYARDFVSEQLEEARSRLEESERDLNAYARSAGLIRTRDPASDENGGISSGSVTTASLMQINEAANAAKANRVAAEGRWNTEKATPLFSSQAVLANPTVQALMTRKSDLEAQLQAARERYLSGHPSIQRLGSEASSVEQQLNSTAANVRNSVRAEFLAARSAEQQLQKQVTSLQGATLQEQDRSVRYNTLAREADTNRSLYDGLLQRYRELNASSGVASSNITVVDRAKPPLAPSSPKLFVNLAIGLLFGCGIAAGVLFLRDQIDDAVRVPEDVENKLGLTLLGVIPKGQSKDVDDELADPKSPISEAYNSLRGSLLYSTRNGLPGIISVTSSQPTEGKSTTSIAIAAGFARMGRSTILVDADLRRPTLDRRMELSNDRGLVHLLTSNDDVGSAIQHSSIADLDLIPSGGIPPSATELLNAPRMAAVLQELSNRYDVVIVDSPPILGLADAPAIAGLTDGTILVVEAERVHSGQLRHALKRLKLVNPVLLGAVLTKFDPDKGANRYSAYYGADYYRYNDSSAAAT